MFDSLLALSPNGRRLAYVTAQTETMDDAHLWWIDVAQPDQRHQLAAVAHGLAPIRPVWSPNARQVAYIVGVELWVATIDGPSQKRRSLPADTFAAGHASAICWAGDSTVGVVAGLESVQVQPGPFTAPVSTTTPASPPSGTATASRESATGSPCGVPVMSQNDPAWRQQIMQVGGDPIGGYGCALTSTAMLMDYYGASVTPPQLSSCLGEAADPLYWGSAPGCTGGRVSGGEQSDFSWERLDALLGQGRAAIVGMVGGITGMHFVVVTAGGGGLAQNYRITDPWDGTTTKSLGSYVRTGSNPRWIITYDGQSRNCGRLVQAPPPAVDGVRDGDIRHGTVHLAPSSAGGPVQSMTIQQLSGPGGTATQPGTTNVTGPIDVSGNGVWEVVTVVRRPDGTSYVSETKFTIDDQAPLVTVQWLDPAPNPPDPGRPTLLEPGRIRIYAVDGQSGVASVQYQLDGGDWANASDDVTVARTITVPGVGDHALAFRATDLAGNVSAVGTAPFTVIDVAAPPPPTPGAPPTPTPEQPTSAQTSAPTAPATTAPQAGTAPAAPRLSASASASPANLTTSSCPAMITFTAVISYSGPAGTYQYVWLRSDGAIQTTPGTVSFAGSGTQTVSTTWTLGAATSTFQPFNGWEQLKILSPVVVSNQAAFTLNCTTPPPTFSISASASPANLTTSSCPATITFTAVINYSGAAGTYQYVWLRSDGAVETTPGTVSFSGSGTQRVTNTWTLGAATSTFQPFKGWEQLKILSPVVLSNQASFTLYCQGIT